MIMLSRMFSSRMLVEEDEDEKGGFLGGLHDTLLLTHYTQHAVFVIWQSRVSP